MFTEDLTVQTETSAAGPTYGKESLLSSKYLEASLGQAARPELTPL